MSRLALYEYDYWVLAPLVESDDPNIQYYYDFSQSIAEYTRVFEELKAKWHWQPVTLQNYVDILNHIKDLEKKQAIIIINLCDGDEINGAPGISVIAKLDELELTYTGANAYFYEISTSKIPMKQVFDTYHVPNAKWEEIHIGTNSISGIFERLKSPIIIKPAVSGGSMGLTIKNVVRTQEELAQRITELEEGYRGWSLIAGGLLAEEFITGPEYTSFIIGSSAMQDKIIVYEPVERIFHDSLPDQEKILSFDRLWETYDEEAAMPNNEFVYQYGIVDSELSHRIKQLSLSSFLALGGTGYGRIDIRMDKATGELYVLEVNAQCGLSEDENYTSIGAILKASTKSFTEIIVEIMYDAINRKKIK